MLSAKIGWAIGAVRNISEIVEHTIELRAEYGVTFTQVRPSGTDVQNGGWQLNRTTIQLPLLRPIRTGGP